MTFALTVAATRLSKPMLRHLLSHLPNTLIKNIPLLPWGVDEVGNKEPNENSSITASTAPFSHCQYQTVPIYVLPSSSPNMNKRCHMEGLYDMTTYILM